MRILIADDDAVSTALLTEQLAPFGACDVAADGAAAVRAVLASLADGGRYGLICLDIMMPHLDGQEVLTVVRGLEALYGFHGGAGARIVMVSALGDNASVMRSFRGQCDGYLVKPYSPDRLQALLRQFEAGA